MLPISKTDHSASLRHTVQQYTTLEKCNKDWARCTFDFCSLISLECCSGINWCTAVEGGDAYKKDIGASHCSAFEKGYWRSADKFPGAQVSISCVSNNFLFHRTQCFFHNVNCTQLSVESHVCYKKTAIVSETGWNLLHCTWASSSYCRHWSTPKYGKAGNVSEKCSCRSSSPACKLQPCIF